MKRQAMDEVQKAVAEAEQKAFEMIAAERAKMEKTLAEAKRKAQEDAIMVINEQEDSSEVSTDVGYRASTMHGCVDFLSCILTTSLSPALLPGGGCQLKKLKLCGTCPAL